MVWAARWPILHGAPAVFTLRIPLPHNGACLWVSQAGVLHVGTC